MNAVSKWIWPKCTVEDDMYGEFAEEFNYQSGKITLKISADSNYVLYINGQFAESGQYPDFPHYKVYDELDITNFCRVGKNIMSVVVWHYGRSWQTYFPGKAALRYELYSDEQLVAYSSSKTPSRVSKAYKSGYNKMITGSIGCSFLYDIGKEDDWMKGILDGFGDSVTVDQDLPMFVRPVEKVVVKERMQPTLLKSNGNTFFQYDLGAETVGYITVDVESPVAQTLTVAFGEHIYTGNVIRFNGRQDYSVEINLKPGRNVYTNYFRRLGLRYFEVFSETPVNINFVSILPTEYPINRVEYSAGSEIRQRIYDVAVRTLELCMHDHYEDCPWREQALYALDGRNQMLCGFYCFNEYKFPRSNLLLMSKDEREDGLLSICTPTAKDQTIPSFSLFYFMEIYEYSFYSGDLTLASEVYGKLLSILDTFKAHLEDDCLPIFTDPCHWNFYDWAEGLKGKIDVLEEKRYDAALNFLFVLALQYMQKISDMLGIEADFLTLASKVKEAAVRKFYNAEKGLFLTSSEGESYSELVNSLAILCDAAENTQEIAELLADNESELVKTTLSTRCFKYDALIKVNKEKYKYYILDDIEKRYGFMLEWGATSFWETEDAYPSTGIHQSLCHGWSSMPVYYYHILLK